MIITMILILAFGFIAGVGVMGLFNSNSYDKGYEDGKVNGTYEKGYEEGKLAGEIRGIAYMVREQTENEAKK